MGETASANKGPTFAPTFFSGMAVYLILIVIAGFWPTYFGPLFSEEAPGHPKGLVDSTWVIHLHGLAMLGWMGLLLFQTALVAREKPSVHMRIGRYGAIFGILVFLSGLLITFVQMRNGLQEGVVTWSGAFLLAWPSEVELLQFSLLLYLGYRFRSQPETHKRYMLFATMVLITAATSRMEYLLGTWSTELMAIPLVAPVFFYDLHTKRRIHQATLIGTGILSLLFIAKAILK